MNIDLYMKANQDFEYFHKEVLGNDSDVFDGLLFKATNENMLSVALWLTYFSKDRTIVVDGMDIPSKQLISNKIDLILKKFDLLHDPMEEMTNSYSDNVITFLNGSRMCFKKKVSAVSLRGLQVNTFISNRSLNKVGDVADDFLPVLYSSKKPYVKFLSPETKPSIELRNKLSSLLGEQTEPYYKLVFQDNHPQLRMNIMYRNVHIYNEHVNGTIFNGVDVTIIHNRIENTKAYKLIKMES